MSVNLNEFSIEQLEFALHLFEEKITDLNSDISFHEEFHTHKDAISEYLSKKLDTAILWKVQIQNAIAEQKVQLS